MGVLSNARWVGLSQAVRIAAQVIGMVVLARLVPPAEYGIMAMAAVVTNFAMIFRDMGTSAAIIQRPSLDEQIKVAVFWFNILVGLGIAVLVAVASPLIVGIFNAPKLLDVLLLLALAFPISSSAAVHQALLERESKFRVVTCIEITSTLIGLAVAILMGWQGFGVYSLVAQTLVSMGVSSLQLWIVSSWRPRWPSHSSWYDLKSILGFSSNLVGFNIINYFSRNADNVIIGHFFPPAMLGAYSLAYRVMLFPLQSLTFVISRSLYPLLAKQQSDSGQMKKIYLQVVAVVATLVAPMMGGMVVLREAFITLFLGKGWELSGVFLLWLAPTGFIQSILSTTGVVFMAKAATKTLMWLGLLGAVLQVGAFLLGVNGGVETMVKLYLVANILNSVPVMLLCMRQMGGSLLEVFKMIWVPVSSALGMIVLLTYSLRLLQLSNPMTVLVTGITIGILSYAILYLALGRKHAIEMIGTFRRKYG